MEVIKISSSSGYKLSTSKFFEFDRYREQTGDYVLIEGGFEKARQWEQFGFSKRELDKILSKKVVLLEFEDPNKFFVGDNAGDYDEVFYKIMTICPYTAKWFNKIQKNSKRIFIYYPFNEKHIPEKQKKKYDIIYAGNMVSNTLLKDLKVITNYNYRFVANNPHPLVTDEKASHENKMNLIAQSKITLVHNLLFPKIYHIPNIWRIPHYQENEALKLIPRWYQPWKFFTSNIVVPQVKSRLFEAAFGQSLILCKKDPFNLIEIFFKEGKEFIYYEESNLKEKIEEILKNYHKYKKVIDNAYKRAITEYTTEAFFKKYLKDLT